MKIAVIFHRLGPYHIARLKAANKLCELYAVELSKIDDTYAWDVVTDKTCFQRLTLFTDSDVEKKSSTEIFTKLKNALLSVSPDVVAVPGWSGQSAFLVLMLCRNLKIPTVAMSASNEHDYKRYWWKEWVKSRVVNNFSSALVGGKPQKAYMNKLGLPLDCIFCGYDVVDNDHFASGALKIRETPHETECKLNLAGKMFIGSFRFIAEKNIDTLIRAYALYRSRTEDELWKLVLLGDGVLRPQIEYLIEKLGLGGDVLLPGFKQYSELPTYYGLAKAYILASTKESWGLVVNEAMAAGLPVLVSNRCGCAPDLVQEGVNGYTFDPLDVEKIASLMMELAADIEKTEKMGGASRRIIADWTPETFAQNLLKAAQVAVARPLRRLSWLDRVILRSLAHR
jgi:1,2-diacylglycerol 3-alpha-glucosyltransferase